MRSIATASCYISFLLFSSSPIDVVADGDGVSNSKLGKPTGFNPRTMNSRKIADADQFFVNLKQSDEFKNLSKKTANAYDYKLEHEIIIPYIKGLRSNDLGPRLLNYSQTHRFTHYQLQVLTIGSGGISPLCDRKVVENRHNLRWFNKLFQLAENDFPVYRQCATNTSFDDAFYFSVMRSHFNAAWKIHIKKTMIGNNQADRDTVMNILSGSQFPNLNNTYSEPLVRQIYPLWISMATSDNNSRLIHGPTNVIEFKYSSIHELEFFTVHGARADVQDTIRGNTPWHYIIYAHDDSVRDSFMLNVQFPKVVNMANYAGNNGLMNLIRHSRYLSKMDDTVKDHRLSTLLRYTHRLMNHSAFHINATNKRNETLLHLAVATNVVPLIHIVWEHYQPNIDTLYRLLDAAQLGGDQDAMDYILCIITDASTLALLQSRYPSYKVYNDLTLDKVKDLKKLKSLIISKRIDKKLDFSSEELDVCPLLDNAITSYNSTKLSFLLLLKGKKCSLTKMGPLVRAVTRNNVSAVFLLAHAGFQLNQRFNHKPLFEYVLRIKSMALLRTVLEFEQVSFTTNDLITENELSYDVNYPNGINHNRRVSPTSTITIENYIKKYYHHEIALPYINRYIANVAMYGKRLLSLSQVDTHKHPYDFYVNIVNNENQPVSETNVIYWDCNRQDSNGFSYSFDANSAFTRDNFTEVKLYVEGKHCDINLLLQNHLPTYQHMLKTYPFIFYELLRLGANPNIFYTVDTKNSEKFLSSLLQYDNAERSFVRNLIDAGFNSDLVNKNGSDIVLQILCNSDLQKKQDEFVYDHVIQSFPKHNVVNYAGVSPMQCLANDNISHRILEKFVRAKYNINIMVGSETLITHTRVNDQTRTYNSLLKLGADVLYPEENEKCELVTSLTDSSDAYCWSYIAMIESGEIVLKQATLVEAFIATYTTGKWGCAIKFLNIAGVDSFDARGHSLLSRIVNLPYARAEMVVPLNRFNLEIQNKYTKNTPLISATQRNAGDWVRVLLEHNVDIFAVNEFDQNAFLLSMQFKDQLITSLMINSIKKRGLMPSMIGELLVNAAEAERDDILQSLISDNQFVFENEDMMRVGIKVASVCMKKDNCSEYIINVLNKFKKPIDPSLYDKVLYMAAKSNNQKTIEKLIDSNIGFSSKDNPYHDDALMEASAFLDEKTPYEGSTLHTLVKKFGFPIITDFSFKFLVSLLKNGLTKVVKEITYSLWTMTFSKPDSNAAVDLLKTMMELGDYELVLLFRKLYPEFVPSKLSCPILYSAVSKRFSEPNVNYLLQNCPLNSIAAEIDIVKEFLGAVIQSDNEDIVNKVFSQFEFSHETLADNADFLLSLGVGKKCSAIIWETIFPIACPKSEKAGECIPQTYGLLLVSKDTERLRQALDAGFSYEKDSMVGHNILLRYLDKSIAIDMQPYIIKSNAVFSSDLEIMRLEERMNVISNLFRPNGSHKEYLSLEFMRMFTQSGDFCKSPILYVICNDIFLQAARYSDTGFISKLRMGKLSFWPSMESLSTFKEALSYAVKRSQTIMFRHILLTLAVSSSNAELVRRFAAEAFALAIQKKEFVNLGIDIIIQTIRYIINTSPQLFFCEELFKVIETANVDSIKALIPFLSRSDVNYDKESCSKEVAPHGIISPIDYTTLVLPKELESIKEVSTYSYGIAVVYALEFNMDALALRLAEKTPVNTNFNVETDSLLIIAAQFDKAAVVRKLIERGADCTYINEEGYTALGQAVRYASHQTVDVFLKTQCTSVKINPDNTKEEVKYYVNFNAINASTGDSILMMTLLNDYNDDKFIYNILRQARVNCVLFDRYKLDVLTSIQYSPFALKRYCIDDRAHNPFTGDDFALAAIRLKKADVLKKLAGHYISSSFYSANTLTGLTPLMLYATLYPAATMKNHLHLAPYGNHRKNNNNILFHFIEQDLPEHLTAVIEIIKKTDRLKDYTDHIMTGENAVMFAIKLHKFDIARQLLQFAEFPYDAVNTMTGYHLIHYAIMFGSHDLYIYVRNGLINMKVDVSKIINQKTGETLLHVASISSVPAVFKEIYEDYYTEGYSPIIGFNPVLQAASHCALTQLERLLSKPELVRSRDSVKHRDVVTLYGMSNCEWNTRGLDIIFTAAKRINYTFDDYNKESGNDIVLEAIENKKLGILKYLIKTGYPVGKSINPYNGRTILHAAVHNGFTTFVRVILEEGLMNPTLCTTYSTLPAYAQALQSQDDEIIKLLQDYGANSLLCSETIDLNYIPR